MTEDMDETLKDDGGSGSGVDEEERDTRLDE
jgi:hypothetical protein